MTDTSDTHPLGGNRKGDDEQEAVSTLGVPDDESKTPRSRNAFNDFFDAPGWKYAALPLISAIAIYFFLKEREYDDKLMSSAAQIRSEIIKKNYETIRIHASILLENANVVQEQIIGGVKAQRRMLVETTEKSRVEGILSTVDSALIKLEIEFGMNLMIDSDYASEAAYAAYHNVTTEALYFVQEVRACLRRSDHPIRTNACERVLQRQFDCPSDGFGRPSPSCKEQEKVLASQKLLNAALALLRLLSVR